MRETVFMRRALDLAAAAPVTSPNPRVGAVVVRDGVVIGEGSHLGAGHPHAERVALDGVDARGATLYVNLEPCVHHGRTPPCAPAVVQAGIARVVVATEDPDERAGGRGITFLRDRGVQVDIGLLEGEARYLNAPFVHHRMTGRPLLTLKLALTLDGRLAARDGSSQWITGAEARQRVHERRARVDAVLVGAATVLADDPSLTARGMSSSRQPARVIADAAGKVSAGAKVLGGPGDVIVATTDRCPHEVQTSWKERGAEVLVLDGDPFGVSLIALLDLLGGRGHLEVFCEGGGLLATSLLREALVGRLELFYGAILAGSGGADIGDLGIRTLGEAPRWSTYASEQLGNDFFVELHSSALSRMLAPSGAH